MGRHAKNCQCVNCRSKLPKIEGKVTIEQDGVKVIGQPKDPQEPIKNPALDKRLKELEAEFTMTRGSTIKIEPKERIDLYAFDYVTDGGLARCEGGHKIELYGAESSGKTTLALKIVARSQQRGRICAWINAENSYDPTWAEINGVDNSRLLLKKPETLEEAGDLLLSLISKVDLIVIDSVVSLIPKAELEGSMEDKHYASQAQIYAPLCRKINQEYKNFMTNIIFINQVREKVGIVFGNPETTPCGKALKHLYDTRLQIKKGKLIEITPPDQKGLKNPKKEAIGNEILLVNKKNKKGKPFRQAIVDFYHTGNFDNRKSLFFAGLKYLIIKSEGKTYQYKDLKVVGQDNFIETLTEPILKQIEEDVWRQINPQEK